MNHLGLGLAIGLHQSETGSSVQDFIELEDSNGVIELEDGSGFIQLET